MKHTAMTYAMVLLAALCTGCKEESLLPNENNFINTSKSISLTVDSKTILGYSSATHQLGFNDEKNEFRVSNDNFSKYFVITCSKMPSQAGENVEATLVYTDAGNKVITETGTFRVSKINEDKGRLIWLWNPDRKIGVVVQQLQ